MTIAWLSLGQECPVSKLNDTFFMQGRPPYLSTPAQHPSDDTICPKFVGNLSCCSKETLADISSRFNTLKSGTSKNMSSQLDKLDNLFNNVSRIDLNNVVGGTSGERLRLVIAKLTTQAKTKFTQLRTSMSKCFTSMLRTQAGFLCAACATDFPVNVTAGPRPKLRINENTMKNLSESCQDFSTGMKDSVDEYHRVKAQIVDYLTGEIGEESDDCTCTGEKSDVNETFNFNFGNAPPAKTLRLLPEEAPMRDQSRGMLNTFTNEIRRPRNDTPPNIVNNQSNEPERQADQMLKNDTKNFVMPKQMKRQMFSDFKGLALGLYLKLSKSLNFRAYTNIRKDLEDMLKVNMFAFDEGFALAQKLAASFSKWRDDWFNVRQLIGKMAVDFLLNVPWSTGENTKVGPSQPTNSTQQQQPGGQQPGGQQPVKQAGQQQQQQQQPGQQQQQQQQPGQQQQQQQQPGQQQQQQQQQPGQQQQQQQQPGQQQQQQQQQPGQQQQQQDQGRSFSYKYSFYYVVRDYARVLGQLIASLSDKGITTAEMKFPYIQNNALKTDTIANETAISTLLSKEQTLYTQDGVLLMPIFQLWQTLDNSLADLAPKVVTFKTDYLDKLTDDDKKYLQKVFFTPAYDRRNPQEMKIPTNMSDILKQTIAYYNQTIAMGVISGFRDCLNLVQNKSKLANNFIKDVLMASKRDSKMDGARRMSDNVGEGGAMVMQTCEVNRQRIKLYKNCSGTSDCFACFMNREGKVTQVNFTAGQQIDDVDKSLQEARRNAGLMGKVDVNEMMPYDDDDAINVAKCARMMSARTKLCVPRNIQNQLQLNPLEEPPAINDNNLGPDMLSNSMNRKKFSTLSGISQPEEKQLPTRLLVSEDNEMDFSAADGGVDLVTMTTGLNPAVGTTPSTSTSSASTFGAVVATLLVAILLVL